MHPQAAHIRGETSTVSNRLKHTNYFARHWRGEISFPISFWVNGLSGHFVLGFVLLSIARIVRLLDFNLVIITVVSAMLVIASHAVYVWQLVGNNYPGLSFRGRKLPPIPKFF